MRALAPNREYRFNRFVDSVLSLPPDIRNELLKATNLQYPDDDPYKALYREYHDLDSLVGSYLYGLLGTHKLSIDWC